MYCIQTLTNYSDRRQQMRTGVEGGGPVDLTAVITSRSPGWHHSIVIRSGRKSAFEVDGYAGRNWQDMSRDRGVSNRIVCKDVDNE